jgi:hypothetical protein
MAFAMQTIIKVCSFHVRIIRFDVYRTTCWLCWHWQSGEDGNLIEM